MALVAVTQRRPHLPTHRSRFHDNQAIATRLSIVSDAQTRRTSSDDGEDEDESVSIAAAGSGDDTFVGFDGDESERGREAGHDVFSLSSQRGAVCVRVQLQSREARAQPKSTLGELVFASVFSPRQQQQRPGETRHAAAAAVRDEGRAAAFRGEIGAAAPTCVVYGSHLCAFEATRWDQES